jgi:hypothetical protein
MGMGESVRALAKRPALRILAAAQIDPIYKTHLLTTGRKLMCYQECALYGDLVLFLRDRAAELLAGADGNVAAEGERLDAIIRDWFFTPQERLHGCAPRDLIWAEQKGAPNPVHPEHLADFFGDDDCPICQATLQEVQQAMDAGEPHGWGWHYDDGGFPLIAHYDAEGWDERWAEEEATFADWQAGGVDAAAQAEPPAYQAPPVETGEVSPEEFLARARQPWLDPALHQVARALAGRVDCPEPSLVGLRYRRLAYDEALSLAAGLHEQGVDLAALLAQMEAFPYQNVALDWLSQPELNAAMMVEALEQVIAPEEAAELTRLRHHRDFVFTLARIVQPGARLWLQGWLDAVAVGAFARNTGEEPGNIF